MQQRAEVARAVGRLAGQAELALPEREQGQGLAALEEELPAGVRPQLRRAM